MKIGGCLSSENRIHPNAQQQLNTGETDLFLSLVFALAVGVGRSALLLRMNENQLSNTLTRINP
jgi:hypothetical protein